MKLLLIALIMCFVVNCNFAQSTDPVPPPAPVKYQPTNKTQDPSKAPDTVKKTTVPPYRENTQKKVEPVDNTVNDLFYRRSNVDMQGSAFSIGSEYTGAHGYGGYLHWTQPFDEEQTINLGIFISYAWYRWNFINSDHPEQFTYKGTGTDMTAGVLVWGVQNSEAWNYQALRVGGFYLKDDMDGGWKDDIRWKNSETFAGLYISYEADFYRDESQPYFSRGIIGGMYWRPMFSLSEATMNGRKVSNDPTNKEKWYFYYKQLLLTKKISKQKGLSIGLLADYTDEKRGVTTWGLGLLGVVSRAKNGYRDELLEFHGKIAINPADKTKNGISFQLTGILHINQIF